MVPAPEIDPQAEKSSKKGRTLGCWFEFLVMLILLGIAFALIRPPSHGVLSEAQKNETRELLNTVKHACEDYLAEYKLLPSSSENRFLTDILLSNNSRQISFISVMDRHLSSGKEIIDSWGTPLKIIFATDQSISVISAGKDQVFDTKDDLRAEK